MAGASILGCLEAGSASADLVNYSWSGRVEPIGENPWLLSGDGSALTPDDGTPFTVEALVPSDAVDEDGALNPDFAEFVPVLLTLEIGGEVATVTSPELRLSDDAFDLFDSITLQVQAELFGTTLSFSANVRLPLATFELASPAAPDPPPSFADTLPIQFGGAATSSLVTIPQNETVTGTLEICGESPEPAVWTTPTTGTAAGVDLTLANIASPALVRGPLQGPDFAAAPLCSLAMRVSYDTGSDWTVNLSEPAGTLLLYAEFWRGSAGGVDPVTYQFDAPFTIVSGLTEATVANGNTVLSLPESGFHDGILQFTGPISSLSVDTNSIATTDQLMTFALVPEPGTATGTLAALAALFVLRRLGARGRASPKPPRRA
jgi:hypothetical protein